MIDKVRNMREGYMQKKNVLRLILDFTITALFLIEINYYFIGGKLHEIIGLIIGGLVVVHCVINRKWFVNLFVKKTQYTIRLLKYSTKKGRI